MTPTVFTPVFTMWPDERLGDERSFCVVLNTHRFLSSIGSTTAVAPTGASIGVPGFGHERHDAHRVGRARRPDQGVDPVLGEQFLDDDHRLRRIARIVEDEVFDRQVADLLRQQRRRVLLRNADHRRRAGRRGDHPDLQLGERGGRDQRHRERCRQRRSSSSRLLVGRHAMGSIHSTKRASFSRNSAGKAPPAACRATHGRRRASRGRATSSPATASTASVSELAPIFSHRQTEAQRLADRARREKIAFEVRHRDAMPALGVKAGEIDAEAVVEPILDQLVHQHEILRIEHDPRGIAVMEADLLYRFERGGGFIVVVGRVRVAADPATRSTKRTMASTTASGWSLCAEWRQACEREQFDVRRPGRRCAASAPSYRTRHPRPGSRARGTRCAAGTPRCSRREIPARARCDSSSRTPNRHRHDDARASCACRSSGISPRRPRCSPPRRPRPARARRASPRRRAVARGVAAWISAIEPPSLCPIRIGRSMASASSSSGSATSASSCM